MIGTLSCRIAAIALALWPLTGFAAADCNLKQIASIPASLSAENELQVDATIDDLPVKMQLHTQAMVSTLSRKFAVRAGMRIENIPDDFFRSMGLPYDQKTRVSSMRLGNLRSSGTGFALTATGGDGQDDDSVGMLAADYLQNYDIEIDVAGGKVNLFNPEHCPDKVVYWASEFFKIPTYLIDSGRSVQYPMVDVTIDGQVLRAAIDTGARSNIMRLATAHDRFGLSLESADMDLNGATHANGRRLDVYEHTFKSMSLGGITLHNTKIRISPIGDYSSATGSHLNATSAGQPDLFLGMNLLKQLRLYLSYSESALYFTLATPKQAAGHP